MSTRSYRYIFEVNGEVKGVTYLRYFNDDEAEKRCWELVKFLRGENPDAVAGSVTCYDEASKLVERYTVEQVSEWVNYAASMDTRPRLPVGQDLYLALVPEGKARPESVATIVLVAYSVVVGLSGIIVVELGAKTASAQDALSIRDLVDGLRIYESEAERILKALQRITDEGLSRKEIRPSRMQTDSSRVHQRLGI